MIKMVLLSATDTGATFEDWVMRVLAGVTGSLIIWLINQRSSDKKLMQANITKNHEDNLLSEQKFTLYEEFRTKKETEFSESLKKIESGLSTLIKDVSALKAIAGIKT